MNESKIFVIGICLMVVLGAIFQADARAEDTATTTVTDSVSDELDQSQKELEVLKQRIADKNDEIKKVQDEINKYKKQIEQTSADATTLKGVIKTLEATKAKLNADISLTGKKIQTTNLNIERLGLAINDKKTQINTGLRSLANALQKTNELELRSPIQIVLSNENLYDGWNDLEDLQRFQGSVTDQLELLKSLKKELENNKRQTEKEKKNLTSLKSQLSDQQKIVDQNKTQQSKILTDTKNKESEYRKILAAQLAKKEKLETEILDFEAQLKVAIDASLLPTPGRGVLAYPTESIRITQYFGNTKFATQNPQVYNGMGHNGIDFGVSPGTVIKSAANGIVVDTGNTDTQCYGVSYGKWVLVRHSNGLSTLYAHLSLIKVSPGDGVERGDTIAYSGNTGYSTGPHLHFTVYASQAVHVSGPTEYKSRVCGTYMKLPVSPRGGYLNPLSYL
ncbi:MAG: peptidoglycan DD-metalloendopeptidase family protein [Candidatus Paceibacterota bacterium]|jgi:murein DD-endopeptidase MepM/ murein hydrolase activator NlpD